jgi:hypothetical protein
MFWRACLCLSAMDVRNALSVDGRHVVGCMKSWPGLVELQYLALNLYAGSKSRAAIPGSSLR